MKKSMIICVMAVMILSIFHENSAYSNGAVYGGRGETIFPLKENGIKMVSEKVVAFENSSSSVECLFVLKNLKKTERDIQIGFPFDEGYANMLADENDSKLKPDVFVNGEEVMVQKKKGVDNPEFKLKEKYPIVFAFNVHFAPYEKKEVRVVYERDWSSGDAEGGIGYATMDFGYIVETGALWAGNIEKADFYIYPSEFYHYYSDIQPNIQPNIQPKGYKIKDGVIEWHFKNWKPTKNIRIHFDIPVNSPNGE